MHFGYAALNIESLSTRLDFTVYVLYVECFHVFIYRVTCSHRGGILLRLRFMFRKVMHMYVCLYKYHVGVLG